MNLTEGGTKMGIEKNFLARADQAIKEKHPILRWVFYGTIVFFPFAVFDWFEGEPKTALNVKSDIVVVPKPKQATKTKDIEVSPSLASANEEERFCYEGGFELASGGAKGNLLDLSIDADDYVGKEIIVISHLMINKADSEAISGLVGPTKCYFSIGTAMADDSRGLKFEIRPFTLSKQSDFRSVRRTILKNTSSLSSLGHFKLKGEIKVYTNNYKPYIQVTSIEFLRLAPEPLSASKPDLNVKSEIIAEQEFTPNQTSLLKMTENLLKWDKSAQDNFTMLWGRDLFNNMNISMSSRKPKLESLKPCLMKPENEKALMKDIVIVNCITDYWNK